MGRPPVVRLSLSCETENCHGIEYSTMLGSNILRSIPYTESPRDLVQPSFCIEVSMKMHKRRSNTDPWR